MKENIADKIAGVVEDALEVRSDQYQLSWYDAWAVVRSGLFLVLAAFIANVDLFKTQLATWGVNEFWIAIIIFMVIDLARRFENDNR